MPKKKKTTSKPTAGFISRVKIIVASVIFLFAASGSVYALTTYQAKIDTYVDTPTVETTDTDKLSATGSSKPTTAETKPATTETPKETPKPSPSEVVTPAPSSEVPSLAPAPTQPSTTITSYQSTNWAGYVATGGTYSGVSGTWIASSPIGTSSSVESADGTWIGIGGITTTDLIQVGTANTVSPTGIVTSFAFYELLPDAAIGIPSVTVNPGDTISAYITQTAATQWTIAITNVSTGQSFSISVTYASSQSSAEWIQEDPSYPDGSLVHLNNFGTVQFSNASATVNGTTMAISPTNVSPITLIGQGGASGHGGRPSAISNSSFTVQYY